MAIKVRVLVRFALAILLVLCSSCSSVPVDPRAYPGSRDDRTLEQLMNKLQLVLPPCDLEGLRYYAGQPFGEFYMTFTATLDCVDQVILATGKSRSNEDTMPGKYLSVNHPLVEDEFGWDINPDQQYELYGGALTPEVSFIMAVDTLVVPQRVYFRATFH